MPFKLLEISFMFYNVLIFANIIKHDGNLLKKYNIKYLLFLLSRDITSEGSIATVKKFDFDSFMIYGSTSLPQSKNVF